MHIPIRHALAAALFSLCSPVMGALPVTSTSFTYTQNFDTLPATGTGTTPQADWTNNSTLSGWYLHAGNNLVADVSAIRVNAGSTSSRSQTSYGTGTSTERSLGSQGGSVHDLSATAGSIADNSTFGTISVGFTNNAGAALTGFSFNYTGEQWVRSSSTGATRDTLTVQWAIGAANAAPTTLTWNNFTAGQTNTAGVNFTAPQKGTSSIAIDGNAAANRITGLGASVANIAWPVGQTLFIRWVDVNDSGTDGGLAVEDFSFSVVGAPVVIPTQTLVSKGAVWKYLDNGSDQGSAWRESWFNESTWASGPAKLGYGEGDEATVVGFGPDANNKYITTYFRRTFTIADPSAVTALRATLQRDDGAVIYLNGREVVRDNMPSGTILYNTVANSPEVSGGAETTFFPHDIAASFLRPGTNTIAVEIHQQRPNSSAKSFNMDLIATVGETTGEAPTVAITSPAAGAEFGKFDPVSFTASAADSDGTITKVEFFRNTTKLGEVLAAPYELPWATPFDGTHSITAIATDNSGNKTISAPVIITVTDKPNHGPVLAITFPADGANFTLPANPDFSVTATDANGIVERVSFFLNGNPLGTLFAAPYTVSTGPLISGSHVLTAIATDDAGEQTTESITITATNPANVPPTVSITAPSNGATLPAGNIVLTSTAADSDGTVAKVEFFIGETKLGEVLAAPYTFTWSSVVAGSYTLTAVATDNDGAQTTSSPVTISVITPPPFSYSQDFNAMGTAATSLPAGWSVRGALGGSNSSWTNTTGIPATGATSAATAGTENNTLIVTSDAGGTGSVNSNTQAYNAALSASTGNRALATAPTSGAGIILQLQLENTSAIPFSQLRISYDTRRFRSVSSANELPGYWLFYSLDGGTNWVSVSDLNPALSSGTVQVPNTVGVTSVSDYLLTLAGTWQPGANIRFRWVDDNATETSPDQFIGLDNVVINSPPPVVGQVPTVALTSPAAGSTYVAPATVSLAADAADADGTVTKVEFYAASAKLGESLDAPYTFNWTNVPAGTYLLTARATDNDGNLAVSSPVSVTVNAPPGISSGPWSGNLTHQSASISLALNTPGIATRAVVSTSADLSNPVYTNTVTSSASSGNAVRLEISGLQPLTTYHYAIETGGFLQTSGDLKGKFTTFPVPGIASYRFAFGSCGSYSNTSQFVYEGIVNDNPLFFIHMGDMNYQDINSTDPNNYRTVYDAQITTGQLRRVCRAMGMAYMWDDHDYAGNDSNKNNIGRTATRQVYRERFPHYPLPAGGPDAAIYQSFSVGRVKYILTDLRSERDPTGNTDNASKSHMGAVQKAWFKQELISARDAEVPLIVWNSSVPFISTSTSGDDWGRFQTERREILEFIRDEKIQNIVIISGDMHALALDDGQGTASYVAGVNIPVFHAAALAQSGSSKGGPYRVGANTITPSQGLGRFGIMDIADDGASLSATFRGRITSGSGSTWTSTADWTFTGSQNSFIYNAEPTRPRKALSPSAVAALSAINVSWADDSNVESGYRIERRPAGSGSFASIGAVAANVTTYADTSVTPATAYDYRVVALNQTIEAEPSAAVTATSLSAYENFRLANGGSATPDDDDSADNDGLGLLLEFAFGLNPALHDNRPLVADLPGSALTTRGIPSLIELGEGEDKAFHALYIRHRNPAQAGISYQPRFTGDLEDWGPGTHVPNVIATDGDYELVSERFPDTVNGKPARFFRMGVLKTPN